MIPSKLYRYQPINKFTIENFIRKSNWTSNPIKFNDPFEFPITGVGKLNKQNKFEYLNKNQLEIRNKIQQDLSKLGVVSYSRKYDNILLWSHYADNHKGICLGFNKIRADSLHAVRYKKIVPILKYSKNENYYKVLIAKNKCWKYEEEYREIFGVNECFSPYCGELTEIIFGCQTPFKDIEMIYELTDHYYPGKMTFSKMFIQENTFNLGKVSIDHIKGAKPFNYWKDKFM